MSTSSTTLPAPVPSAGAFRVYRTEAKYEFLKTLRQPAYVVPTLTFPILFYVMFGIAFGGKQAVGAVNMATYLLATYSTFGVMGASLFGFAVGNQGGAAGATTRRSAAASAVRAATASAAAIPARFERHPAWKMAATGSWRVRQRRGVGHGYG